ncbi:MAG TPA: hypothetical protein VFS16_09970 [Acidimicrobiia bacterium]|nr:hypothetical protein [Acidimicrobiia bacterium]
MRTRLLAVAAAAFLLLPLSAASASTDDHCQPRSGSALPEKCDESRG